MGESPYMENAEPFVIDVTVGEEDIDWLGHVNNAVYLRYLECAAWSHTRANGLHWHDYQKLDAAFVVRHHDLTYLAAAYREDRLKVATWIGANDGRLSLWRDFCITRVHDETTILRARTHYVTIGLSNGRPRRMPQCFIDAYQPIRHPTPMG